MSFPLKGQKIKVTIFRSGRVITGTFSGRIFKTMAETSLGEIIQADGKIRCVPWTEDTEIVKFEEVS
jgi:hypothetical protein